MTYFGVQATTSVSESAKSPI
ncbi:hypothetical protein SUNI508_03762 [Seiridium unicorne]|uniref:Ribulose-1,5-bisphosphate carboxylase/oxygenase large subunit n=1 Tax=Seiridium unicorne TaxID=138068 RepID=A0ABR2VB43_9PEZI